MTTITMTTKEFVENEIKKLDDWFAGAVFGYLFGVLTPILLWWMMGDPLK